MIDKLKAIIKQAKALKEKDLEAIRYSLFFLIVVDLFGIYWFLEAKKLGIALLMVIIMFLVVILMLERNLPLKNKSKGGGKMGKNDEEIKELEDKVKELKKDNKDSGEVEDPEETSQGLNMGLDFDLGLPSSEEYNKRIEKALGI